MAAVVVAAVAAAVVAVADVDNGGPVNSASWQVERPPGRTTLTNGAVILTVPVSSAHSVSLGVWLRRGTQDEPAGLGGLAHFLEHIVFKGSERYSAYDLALGFDGLGVSVDAFTTKDHVVFSLKVLPEYLSESLDILADMLLRPALDPEMIALEQDVVCEEIQEARDTPEDLLHDAFTARIYGRHPRSRPILGSPETVRAFNQAELRRQHQSMLRGDNLVISAAGDLPSNIVEMLSNAFDKAPVPSEGAAPLPVETDGPFNAADDVIASATLDDHRMVMTGPVQQCYFELGNSAIAFHHPDRIPLAILANVLGGGMSSRIFQAVREREGLAYSIYTYTDMGRDIGLFSCGGSCSPAKMERLEEVVRQEYRRLLSDGVSEAELENNRAQIKSQLVFAMEGTSSQMGRAAKDEIYEGRHVPLAELIGQVDAIVPDDLMRCAEAYTHPDRWIVATHGPAD